MKALLIVLALAVVRVPLACGGDTRPCVPLSSHDAGCNTSYGVDYDPAVSTGCVFENGSGTADTCQALCGQPATCDLLTFTSVICDVPCGD